MNRTTFNSLIATANWQELFIAEMGWNKPKGQTALPPITIDGRDWQFLAVAQLSGFQVLACHTDELPTISLCRKLDLRLRRQANDYICIYQLVDTQHHLWACPVLRTDKRDMVIVEYAAADKADFLFAKMDGLTFEIGEQTTIIDVRQRVGQTFAVNSERITKSFYAGFRQQHKLFAQFITGIDDQIPLYDSRHAELNRNKLWYASVMLNRLMFCYFVQKKGFLAGDKDYLANRLAQVRANQGGGFYRSFYRDFLVSLFHDGLNAPRHTPDWERRFGRIPYLNGGMFDIHTIERQYPDIDIADDAFEALFYFFDQWQWHLDTRITATGRDINPDVLGYIFEQYINDRAAMGAYYTKEDITEYISRNCIVPFLVDRVAESTSRDAFRPDGEVWATLRNSGGKYIYDAVRHGHTTDWRTKLPDDIARGLITPEMEQDYRRTPIADLPEGHTPLAQLRSQWNRPTPPAMGLPTEIWRETIERLERVDSLLAKISGGQITGVNDFITLNLNLRAFIYDLLATTKDHRLVANFFKALKAITILDPTCGSGAFLFAAMGILEPLYEVCILRMQEFHEANNKLFADELGEINRKYRSNIQYFIYKSIILRNLYGVDIMVEATEIAKLRLFLKMVAVVDVDKRAENMGLDPLPDIDFNIRCGNTLVGYANEKQLMKDLIEVDVFASKEFRDKIETMLQVVANAYNIFRDTQLTQDSDQTEYVEAKKELRQKLAELNELLSRRLFASTHGTDYNEFIRTHQPFHWLAEFYSIIHGNGGFDVVIGNPPYVEFPSKDVKYNLSHLLTSKCGNLYGCCIERSTSLNNATGYFSFIIPVAITCSKRMASAITLLKQKCELLTFANFDDRPGKLFENLQHLRATVFIGKGGKGNASIYATSYNRWYSAHRNNLFCSLQYVNVTPFATTYTIPKFSRSIEYVINDKLQNMKSKFANFEKSDKASANKIYYRSAGGGYFALIKDTKSITYIDGKEEDVVTESTLSFIDEVANTIVAGVCSSSMFYWNYIGYTDCRHILKSNIDNFPFPTSCVSDTALLSISRALFADYARNSFLKDTYYKKNNRHVSYYEYYPKLSKPIIDSIDTVLARHYGFTEEELDFIINYDIKYRMGDELNSDN